ncbi:integral membrane sensor signal transduction histidine kinase [Paenibacillus curdlanolyticus YK9]|uniref:histidine kinase n=1 Tax=Paenibacillus curdlanolyticus YK9 TaxID=717606 RepID=E0ICQ3_9BACL|nr:sensor histidine kinase [Paenibacillus curdlanolyticus]EFM09939.1 integral membrane sensor signal transduction histidine kinase [Paenibacillus curdlanolyticus YK9]
METRRWWRGLRSALTDMPMERKLLIVFLGVISLPLTFIGYLSYSNYTHSIERTTVSYSTNLQEAMMERIDDYIEDMMRISSIPAYQAEIKHNLIRSNQYYGQRMKANSTSVTDSVPEDFNQLLSIQRGIQSSVKFINNIKRGANVVYIFDEFGNGYFSTESGAVRLDLEKSYRQWKAQAEQSGGEALLFGTETYTSNLNSVRSAFTVVRKILDEASLQPIGLIAVDADIRVIEDQIIDLDKLTHGKSFIIDKQGGVIYDSDKSQLSKRIDTPIIRQASGKSGSFYQTVDGQKQLVIYTTSPDTDWKLFILIPERELNKDSIRIRNATLAATFVTIGVALLISILLSFALTKPLRKMMRLMRTVQEGNFKVQFPVKHRDEIGQLGHQFNRMIVRIDQLIQDIYEMETKKNEAEMHALQNQINPHFMYNTLETIRMVAELNDDDAAADMLSVFGKLLRYSIGDVREKTTVKAELEHVRNYIEMLNYRYPNRFDLQMHADPAFHNVLTLKLLLQPIVENAIYHGLDDRKARMRIAIIVEHTERFLLIRVVDNGLGMTAETRERLNRSFSGMEVNGEKRGGIGLKNVCERIKLHYGHSYGMEALEGLDGGTEIVLRLPAPQSELDTPFIHGGKTND